MHTYRKLGLCSIGFTCIAARREMDKFPAWIGRAPYWPAWRRKDGLILMWRGFGRDEDVVIVLFGWLDILVIGLFEVGSVDILGINGANNMI